MTFVGSKIIGDQKVRGQRAAQEPVSYSLAPSMLPLPHSVHIACVISTLG